MVAVAMLMAWAGYAVGGWGYVLVRGWNIPWSEWVNPLHPYEWPASGTPDTIPEDQITPSPASASSGASAGSTGGPGTPVARSGPVVNPRPGRGRVGRTTGPGGPKTGPR